MTRAGKVVPSKLVTHDEQNVFSGAHAFYSLRRMLLSHEYCGSKHCVWQLPLSEGMLVAAFLLNISARRIQCFALRRCLSLWDAMFPRL